jgi:excisionase family DNA binding protein
MEGMSTVASPDKTWLTVEEAVALIGCTDGWVRHLLREGKLEGWRAGERAWLVKRESAIEARSGLTTRSNAKKGERPARQRKRRKSA